MKITPQARARLIFFTPFCILFILMFAFKFGSYVKTIYDLDSETKQLEILYSNLQDEGENLRVEINKLHDPEYIAKYARENYDYSKDGEIIIKIADTNNKIADLNNKQHNNRYVLIIIAFILILMIFIYIIGKGNQMIKNKKKK